ncbi:3-oxo-Delta(4,5)-steroid 5-beta-reductase-like [Cucurbita maxima]|uniref:3-oxo-Delta(4,5)-steroid 5-beta-reductase-like n=1 Tax=Cucurbita maxima TaxID=3661 RepID=A0A6J1I0N6_CUCMA|nr:3-oxo-Delta(4,5)-steroid 5-beta-reductase-like [Cucurbita maxima]
MADESMNTNLDANGELVAVIFGVTGLVGKELAKMLLSTAGWKVYGVARRPDNISPISDPNFHFISCDLLDRRSAHLNLSPVRHVTHMFWITWAAQLRFDSQDCSDQNKAMLANALDAILPSASALRHVSLQTGVKHYASLTSSTSSGGGEVVYSEDSPRAESGNNFYYVLEDLLRERLSGYRRVVAWSILRPGLILGCSNRTFFNFMGSLCVYGAICKKLKMPFVFGGTAACWEEVYIDGSDARLTAEQHVWAATQAVEINAITDREAFNVCNGWSFTWKEIWGAVAEKLGVTVGAEDERMFSPEFHYTEAMAEKGMVWAEIVEEEGLVATEMGELANWGFLDSLFRLPEKMVASRAKSDRLGFTVKYKMLDSILYWIDVMRHDKLIPSP